MNYIVLFANPQYCADKGQPLTWHGHSFHEDRQAAYAAGHRLKACLPALSVRVCKLTDVRAVELSDGAMRVIEQARAAA